MICDGKCWKYFKENSIGLLPSAWSTVILEPIYTSTITYNRWFITKLSQSKAFMHFHWLIYFKKYYFVVSMRKKPYKASSTNFFVTGTRISQNERWLLYLFIYDRNIVLAFESKLPIIFHTFFAVLQKSVVILLCYY